MVRTETIVIAALVAAIVYLLYRLMSNGVSLFQEDADESQSGPPPGVVGQLYPGAWGIDFGD